MGVVLACVASVHAQPGDPYAPCYFPGQPDHIVADDYFPCIIVDLQVSSCCQAGWTCYSNALCIATTPSDDYPDLPIGNVTRTACTSPYWDTNECGGVCLGECRIPTKIESCEVADAGKTDDDNKSGELVFCGDNRFCCESDYLSGKCTCGTDGNATSISSGVARTVIFQDSTPVGTPTINVVSVLATSSSLPTTTRTSTTVSTSSRSSSSVPSAPTASASPEDPEDEPSSNRDLAIGLGIGIPLGVIAVGALIFFVWRRFRNRDEEEPGIINSSGEMGSAGPGTGSFGAMEPDQELRENDAFGPTWVNDYGAPRRTGL